MTEKITSQQVLIWSKSVPGLSPKNNFLQGTSGEWDWAATVRIDSYLPTPRRLCSEREGFGLRVMQSDSEKLLTTRTPKRKQYFKRELAVRIAINSLRLMILMIGLALVGAVNIAAKAVNPTQEQTTMRTVSNGEEVKKFRGPL